MPWQRKIENFILSIDNFGSNIQFTYKGGSKATSLLGGIMTILYYLASVLVFSYNLYLFIYHNDPIISFTSSYRNTREINNVSLLAFNSSFFFFEENENGFPHLLNLDIKDYGIQHIAGDIAPEMIQRVETIGNFVQCSSVSDIYNRKELNPYFGLVNISNMICVYLDEPHQQMGGNAFRFTTSHAYQGQFSLDLCSNFTDCMDEVSLAKRSESGTYKMIALIENTYSNFTERKGFSTSFDTVLFDMDLIADYLITVTFTKNTMKTDFNVLFSFEPDDISIFYSTFIDIKPIDRVGPPNLMNFKYKIVFDTEEMLYFRSYTKIDIFLAAVFSVVQAMFVVLNFILAFFNYGYIEGIFANELTFFKKKENKEMIHIDKNNGYDVQPLKIKPKPIKSIRVESISSNEKVETENNKELINNNYVALNTENVSDIKKKFSGEKIKYNHFIFCFVLCKQKRKKYFVAKEMIISMFDVVNIQKQLIQLEYMREILFDKNQANLFKVFSRKRYSCEELENEKKKNKDEKDDDDNQIEIFNETNQMNENIINFLKNF